MTRTLSAVALAAVLATSTMSCTPSVGKTASNRLALLAGVAGDRKEDEFFVHDLDDLRGALQSRGWSVKSILGKEATNGKLFAMIRETLEQAAPGQQVLILIHTHGREQEPYWGQRSHSIISEDRDATGNDPGFDLDPIEPLLEKAKARGVRIALVDLSCYSGSTQALKGTDCTVTLASNRYVSLCSGREDERHFNSKFFKLPPAGQAVDIEAQFLKARREDLGSINLPQISSRTAPLAAAWDEFLYQVDPLDIFEDLKTLKTGTHPYDPKKLLSAVDAAIKQSPGKRAELLALRNEIAARVQHAVEVRAELEKQMPTLAKDYDEPTLKVEVQGRSPMTLAPGHLGEMLSDHPNTDGMSEPQKNLIQALQPLRSTLEQRYARDLEAFQKRRAAFDALTEELAQSGDDLFEAERRLFDLLSVRQTESCASFAL